MQHLASLHAEKSLKEPRPKWDLDLDAPPDVIVGIIDISEHYGLKLRDKGESIKDKNRLAKLTEEFFVNLVCQKIRHKETKKAASRETVLGWAAELEKEFKRNSNAAAGRFELASLKAIKTRYGSKEIFEMKAGVALLKIVGVHYFAENRTFDYSVTFPGIVVETNGEIPAANTVRWRFLGESAWLLGRDMNCRTLEAQTQLDTDLLQGQPLSGPEAMLEFVKLIHEEKSYDRKPLPRLLDVLQVCRLQKSMTPLYEHRQNVL